MRTVIAAAAAVFILAGTAHAQRPEFRPVDTNALVVKPVTTTTNIFAQGTQAASQVVSGMIDNSQLIKAVNNLFGKRQLAAPVQPGLSPLPDPKRYPSTYYKSPIQPVLPRMSAGR